MACDICNASNGGTIIKAADMSRAVQSGFNPFEKGLLADLSLALGTGAPTYPAWRESAISGSLSGSDWDVCSRCLPHLTPYLSPQSEEVTFSCPNCSQHLSIHESYRGDQIECPTCNAQIAVPPSSIVPAAPTPSSAKCAQEETAEIEISGLLREDVAKLCGSVDYRLDIVKNVASMHELKKLAEAIRYLERCERIDKDSLKELHTLLGDYGERPRLAISEVHSRLGSGHLQNHQGITVKLPTDDPDRLKALLQKLLRGTFDQSKSQFGKVLKVQASTSPRARAALDMIDRITPESIFSA